MSDGRGNDVKASLQMIQNIDDDGLWVTARDQDGMEIDIEITGLTPEVIRAFLARG